MGGFPTPANPIDQQYQTDDQFYDTNNGGGFDNFGQDDIADEINKELDQLLGNTLLISPTSQSYQEQKI